MLKNINIMEIQERIKEILKKENVSQKSFAEHFGLKPQVVNQWTNAKYSVGIEPIKKLLDFFPTLNARWLILGTGSMYEKSSEECELEKKIEEIIAKKLAGYDLSKARNSKCG